VEEAIRLCEARKNRPGHGVGDAIVLGRCYLADGRLSDARAEFETALSLDRENVSALKALAGILAHEGRPSRAVDLYRAVCRVDPGDLESQTALQQITSGEYAEVCPADVLVEQGDLGWQPVRLPREEDHLSDLGLGLRTIESFDAESTQDERERARSFQELTLEELERATHAVSAPGGEATAAEEPELSAVELKAPTELNVPLDQGEPAVTESESPDAPARGKWQGSASRPGVSGNRSAFEDWLRRLGGGGS